MNLERLVQDLKEVEKWYGTLEGSAKRKVDSLLREVVNEGHQDPFAISVRFLEELIMRAENKA